MNANRPIRRFSVLFLLASTVSGAFVTSSLLAAETPVLSMISIVGPRGAIDQKEAAELQWNAPSTEVPFTKYDVTLYRYAEDGSNPKAIRKTSVPSTQTRTRAITSALPAGLYAWKVEAKNSEERTIGAGQTRFRILGKRGPLKARLGLALFRVTYHAANDFGSTNVPVDANGFGGGLEYEFSKWRALFDFSSSSMLFRGESMSFSGYRIGGRYSRPFKSNPQWGWYGGLKYDSNSIPEITAPNATTYQTSKVSRTSIDPELGVEYSPDPALTLLAGVEFAKNLSLSGGGYGSIVENKTSLGYDFVVGAMGSLIPEVGYDLRLKYFKDGYAYTTATEAVTVEYTGFDVLLSITLRPW